jgi:hypothetical protein
LKPAEMKEQVEIYLSALAKAKLIIAEKKKAQPDERPADNAKVQDPRQTEMDI